MKSTILITASKLLHPLLLMFSIFLLFRGHNEPGGGFSGGLVAAGAFILHMLAHDVKSARRALRVDPHVLIAAGLLTSLLSGLVSVFFGYPFLTGAWVTWDLPAFGKWSIGTPLLFDIGVYLVVIGITMLIILTTAEE